MNANPKKAFGDKKPPLGQVPLTALIHGALAFYDGKGKYGNRNWRENHVEAQTYIEAILRHVLLWANGEELARDTKVHNLGGVIASAGLLLDAQANGCLIDNRVKSQAACDLLHEAEKNIADLNRQHAERRAQIEADRLATEGAPYGWVCFNDGPSGWFWCATREECEHELTDFNTIRPASAMEKSLWHMAKGLDPDLKDVVVIRDEVSGDWGEHDLGHVVSPAVDPKPVGDLLEDIPKGVYYSEGYFYDSRTFKWQGQAFHDKWRHRAHEFPTGPTVERTSERYPENMTPGPDAN